MKILIIEDEKLLADSIRSLLENKGFEVETAYDGETGEEYAELGVYDLLILDVMMPKMDGYQVARTVRAKRCSTPILMLTAKSALEDRIDELAYGNTALDLDSGMLICGENSVRLSAREFDVMRFLLQSRGRNLSKEVILARVWGYDSNAVENHVEVYVGFLRKKLQSIGSNIRIEAVRRLGYHLEVEKEC